jgi:cytoskeletal protein CcmA (bactofilin family)
MFSKTKRSGDSGRAAPAAAERPAGGVPSIISPDLTVTGNLTSDGDVQVDGAVDGDVTAQTLTLGEHGRVHGTVTAARVKVCGTIVGEIAGGTVTLAASAKVSGDVVHDSLAIEPGAFLEGHCRRRTPDGDSATQPEPAGRRGDRQAADGAAAAGADGTGESAPASAANGSAGSYG